MEALVVIFAEIILACLMPVLGLIGALLGAIFEGLLLLLGGTFAAFAEVRRKRRVEAGKSGMPGSLSRRDGFPWAGVRGPWGYASVILRT